MFMAAVAAAAILVGVNATPAFALTNPVVGSTWDPAQMSTRQPHYPAAEISRVFFTATQCPSWSDSRLVYMQAHNIIPFISMKNYNISCLVSFINAKPANVPAVWTTYYHEGEANMAAATWKSRQNAMWNAVKVLPNHLNGTAKYMSVQTRQWTENNGRSYGTYWCGCGDYFAVDMYVNSWENAYPNVNTFFSQSLNFAISKGYHVFYPELGAIRMPSDPTGTGRAAFITGSGAKIHNNEPIVGAIWWDDLGSGGREFSLNQGSNYSTPEENAWNAFLNAN